MTRRTALAIVRQPDTDLDFEVEAFLNDLRIRRRSPRTIEFYREALDQFRAHLVGRGRLLDPAALEPDDFLSFEDGLRAAGRAGGTVAARHRALRAFCHWLVAKEVIERSPMAGIPEPKPDTAPPPVPEPADVDRVIASLRARDFRTRRDRALLSLMADTGLRLSECANVKLTQLRLAAQELDVDGKTGPRTMAFGNTCRAAIEDYLRERRKHRYTASPWLWIGERGRRGDSHFNAKSIHHMVVARARAVGVELHPHLLRHGFVDIALRGDQAHGIAPVDPVSLAHLLGWSGIEMAMVYARATGARRARDIYRQQSVLDRRRP